MTFSHPPFNLQSRSRSKDLLHRITTRIRQSLQLQEILQATVTEVRAFLGTDRVMVYRFYPDEHGEVIAEAIYADQLPSLMGLHFPADDIPSHARKLLVSTRQRSVVDLPTRQIGWSAPDTDERGATLTNTIDYRPIDPCHAQYLQAMGVQSSVVVPILQAEQLWGLLVAHHSQARTVSEADLHFLQLVVDQVAIAIAQSTLLSQVQAQAHQESVANSIATLLHSESTHSFRLAHPFQLALKATITAIGGSGGQLFLSPTEVNQTGELYRDGIQPAPFVTGEYLKHESLWDFHRSPTLLAIADLYQDERCLALTAHFQDTPIRSLLIVPLHLGQQHFGYLTLFRNEIETETLWAGKFDPSDRQSNPRQSFERWREHKTGQAHAWTEADLALVEAIRSHFVLAIKQHHLQAQIQALNASLERQVQAQTRDLANIQFALDQSSIIAITDRKGIIGYVNDKFCETSGYQREELIGQTHRLINSGYHPKEFFSQMWQTIASGTVWRGEICNRAKNGSLYWVHATIVPLLDAQGMPQRYVAIRINITERKRVEAERQQAEMALQASNNLLRSIIDSTSDMILVKDLQGHHVTVNSATADFFDQPIDTIVGKGDLELFPPEIAHPLMESDQEIIRNGVPSVSENVVIKEGQLLTYLAAKSPWRDAQGQVIGLICIARNISDRKQAEIALQQTTQSLQKAQQLAHIGSWEYATATDTITWSDETYHIFGLPPGTPVPSFPNLLQMFHPDHRERFAWVVSNALQSATTYDEEFRIVRLDGTIRSVDAKGEPLCDETGKVVGLFGTVMDITDRKQAEEALMLYKRAVDSASDAIAIFDPKGTLIYQNAAHVELYGCESVEVYNQTGGFVACYLDQELPQLIIQSLIQGHGWIGGVEQQSRTGRQFSALLRTYGITDETKKLTSLVGIITDISDRKRAEEVLRQKAQQERLLNQLASQIRSSLDIDQILETAVCSIRDLLQVDRCTFVWYRPHIDPPSWECVYEAKLPELATLRGLYPSSTIGSTAQRLKNLEIVRDDDVTAILDPDWRHVLRLLGLKSNLLIPMLTNTGAIGVISCSHQQILHPWQESEVELLLAVANQLTIAINQADLYKQSRLAAETAQAKTQQLEQTLQELQQTQAQLVQTEKMSSLGQLVAGVAHEINNPVNFIYGNLTHAGDYIHDLLNLVQLYQQHYPEPASEIQAEAEAMDLDFLKADLPKLLASMKVGADRIQQIVLALRNFSRMDEAEVKAVDLHEGIDSTLMILQNRLKETAGHPGIQVIKDYGKLPLVECYAGQLNQVFMNILSNAIDALDELNHRRSLKEFKDNPATITIQTSLINQSVPGQAAASQWVRICIADNGSGMTEPVRQRLFEPFFTTKPVGKGTGLGLSISYQVVVDKHGGKLSCSSAPGAGAKFSIELPLQPNVTSKFYNR